MSDQDQITNPGQSDIKPRPLPADLQREVDELLAGANDPDQGTPPAAGAPGSDAATNVEQSGKMIGELLHVTFNGLIAPKRGPHWKMTGDECQALGLAYAAVLDKYAPNLQAGPEATAIVLTVAIVGPRVAKDAELQAQNADRTDQGEPEAAPAASTDAPSAAAVFGAEPGQAGGKAA